MISYNFLDARQRIVRSLRIALLATLLAATAATAAPNQGPPRPSNLECRSGVTAVGLTWTGNKFATAYRVERGADESSAVEIAETSATSFVDETTPVGQTQMWLVRSVDGKGNASVAVSCTATAIGPGNKPFLGPPIPSYEDRTLLTFGAPSAAKTSYGMSVELRRVPSPGWQARLLVGILAEDGTVAAELAALPAALPSGDSTFTDSIDIDALALALPVGSYTLRGTLVVAPAGELPAELTEAAGILSGTFEPTMSFISTPDDSLRVLDYGDDEIAAYWAAIGSGNADTAYKAVSALMNHYRDRGLYAESEQEVLVAADFDVLLPYRHILRYWAVDDRLLAGDHPGAVGLLTELIDQAPAGTGFLGEPYRARGLFDLAALHRRVDNHEAVHATLAQLITEEPMFHRPTVRSLYGESLLELGEQQQAQAVFQDIVDSAERCTLNEREPCPTIPQVVSAEEWIELIQSPREWFRPQPEELLQILETVVANRDLEMLETIVPDSGLRFVVGAGEHSRARWSTLRRFFDDALALSPELSLQVRPAYGPRQSVVLSGLAPAVGAGPGRAVVLTLESTPFGWQWSRVAGIMAMSQLADDDGDWDPCSLDPVTGLPTCPQPPPPSTPPPVGGTPARLHIQAPWASGAHMRAGGLSDDLSILQNGEMVVDLLVDLLSPLNDSCGNSVPGYLYGLGTHTNEDHFAIDFTQGHTFFCIFGVCVTPPGAILGEVLEALADTLLGSPTTTPAYDDPVLAARAGLVIDSDCSFDDGDTDSDHANRVEVAVWDRNDPVSIARLLETVPSNSATKGELLNNTQADYWLRYLHLRKDLDCPSRGSWVEQGQVIGRIDDTGNSFTSHLHFVVRHRPDTDAHVTSNWPSAVQIIDGDHIGHDDNGACIKSHNELSRSDTDGDGILDPFDNCTTVPNPDQLDVDFDMIGEACDDNTSCPWDATEDWDGDGTMDACDSDLDGDGVDNDVDACPFFDDAIDLDGDGEPDECDNDVDGDGFSELCQADHAFACGCLKDEEPADPNSAGDHDGDGIDSLTDSCPCSDFNPTCEDLVDLPPPGLGGAAAAEWGEPHGPGSPYDPYGPGGSPHGPGGQFP